MKFFAAILMILIMVFLSLTSFASRAEANTLRQKMVDFEAATKPHELLLNAIEVKTSLIADKYGYDFKKMDDASLKEYVDGKKEYYAVKLAITDFLSQIYFASYSPNNQTVDDELKLALTKYESNCSLLNKISDSCMSENDMMVFQAIYLDLRIDTIETIQAALMNEINAALFEEQEDVIFSNLQTNLKL